eukprot:198039-Hanusia_phi.AAC.1
MHFCSKESSKKLQECQELNVEGRDLIVVHLRSSVASTALLARFLSSYGLNGSLSLKDRKTKVLSPLLNVNFCSLPKLPNNSYAAVKELFAASSSSGCSDSLTLRSTAAGQNVKTGPRERSTRVLRALDALMQARSRRKSPSSDKPTDHQKVRAVTGIQQTAPPPPSALLGRSPPPPLPPPPPPPLPPPSSASPALSA